MSDIDRKMADWRSTDMRQKNPHSLEKIEKCLLMVKHLIKPEDSLLDVGCGRGFVYGYLGHKNYLGIDLNEVEVEQAGIRFTEGRFEVRDLFDIQGEWDVVLCSRVLIHVAPFDLAMEKLLAAAKKKLLLIVAVENQDRVDEIVRSGERFYFRSVSRDTLKRFGPCEIYDTRRYSLVVYDRVPVG